MDLPELQSIQGIPTEEQETVITFSRGSNEAQIYTCDNTMLTKIKNMRQSAPDNYQLDETFYSAGEVCGYTFIVPKKCVSFRAGLQREYSEEERQASACRLKKMREAKKNG